MIVIWSLIFVVCKILKLQHFINFFNPWLVVRWFQDQEFRTRVYLCSRSNGPVKKKKVCIWSRHLELVSKTLKRKKIILTKSEVADETFVINLKTRQRSTSLQCYNFIIKFFTKLVVLCVFYSVIFLFWYHRLSRQSCPIKKHPQMGKI